MTGRWYATGLALVLCLGFSGPGGGPSLVAATGFGEDKPQADSQPGKPTPPAVKLIEGERVHLDEIMIIVNSALVEEGDAIKQLARNEANLNNVRYQINSYQIGYAIASEKLNSSSVFVGPTKGWRASGPGEVSRWPLALYAASRKETTRQAKLMDPIPIAQPLDEMNNLRVYYRPVLVDHDGERYQEEPSVLAFFVHPRTGTRMTVLFRGGRSYGTVDQAMEVSTRVDVKQVVPGRGGDSGTLVPSVFTSEVVSVDVEPFPAGAPFDRLMQAALAAHEQGHMAADDFQGLFEQMSRYTGGKTEPVGRPAETESAERNR